MKRQLFADLCAARAQKLPVAVLTRLSDGAQALITAASHSGELQPDTELLRQCQQHLNADTSCMLNDQFFLRSYTPPSRLIIIGAVHIAQFLAPMAALAGYEVTLIDPRQAFANTTRFPDCQLCTDWPQEAMRTLAPDRRTAVVALTHDPKIDDPALAAALRSPAFYIGALGSRRTHAQRLERLAQLGLGDQLARIHGPIGLNLGGRQPAEIAVAALAQMVQIRHQGESA